MAFRIPLQAAACVFALLPAVALGQAGGGLEVELNNAAEAGGACRLTFIVTNKTSASIGRMAIEGALYDGQGIVRQLSVFDFGATGQGETSVMQFEIPAMPCTGLSRITFNTPPETCAVTDGPASLCQDRLVLRSRTAISLR